MFLKQINTFPDFLGKSRRIEASFVVSIGCIDYYILEVSILDHYSAVLANLKTCVAVLSDSLPPKNIIALIFPCVKTYCGKYKHFI